MLLLHFYVFLNNRLPKKLLLIFLMQIFQIHPLLINELLKLMINYFFAKINILYLDQILQYCLLNLDL